MPFRRGGGRGRGGGRFTRGRGGQRNVGRGSRGRPSALNRQTLIASGGAITGQTIDDDKLDIDVDAKAFFLGVASFDKHYEAQCRNTTRYAGALALLAKIGVEISDNAKVRALASAWARDDKQLARCLLKAKDLFGLVEVVKAITILDSARQIRQLEKKMERWESINKKAQEAAALQQASTSADTATVEMQDVQSDAADTVATPVDEQGKKIIPKKATGLTIVKKKTFSKTKVKIDNLKNIKPSVGSVSGALCREIRKWAGTFSKEELEFFAMHMPTAPWRKLADIVHFNPKDFVNAEWFLPHCYGAEAPVDSAVQKSKSITKDTVNSIVQEVAVPFTHVRNFQQHLTNQSKCDIVRNEDKVTRGIWWYEELQCSEVDKAIQERLDNGEDVDLNYGKLMERLITFKKMNPLPSFFETLMAKAEAKLENNRLNLDAPIVVLADASSSMSVAIETATIISSLLTACTCAELVFFNNKHWYPETQPRTIADVLNLALSTRATNCTSHAAGLMPYYEEKKMIKTLIIVTDEEENTACKGTMFLPLYQKYLNEVNSACQLVFVSFLRSQSDPGQMVSKLRKEGISCMQLVMSRQRPDLTKLDNLLGQLSSRSADFAEQLLLMQQNLEKDGMDKVFTDLFSDSLRATLMAKN